MKAIVLCLISILMSVPLFAQQRQDSITSEISALEKLKADISARIDLLSDQLTKEFAQQQAVKTKIEEVNLEIENSRSDKARLQAKRDLTSRDKKTLEAFKGVSANREKLEKMMADIESKFSKKLAILDEAIGLRNELQEKIQQLKASQPQSY